MKPIFDPPARELLRDFARSNVLLAFDFDGTLSPIVDDPSAAAMRPATRSLLARVARLYPTAVISGRSKADVAKRVRDVPLVEVVGNHGLEPARSEDDFTGTVAGWRKTLERFVRDHPGCELEDKVLSVAVHYRRCRSKKAALADLASVVERLGPHRLIAGKEVVNILPAGAPNKGTALESLRQAEGCDTAIYVGDDVTDEDVFLMEVPGRLLGIRVERSADSAAPFFLRDQGEVDLLLRALCEDRAAGAEVRS